MMDRCSLINNIKDNIVNFDNNLDQNVLLDLSKFKGDNY